MKQSLPSETGDLAFKDEIATASSGPRDDGIPLFVAFVLVYD